VKIPKEYKIQQRVGEILYKILQKGDHKYEKAANKLILIWLLSPIMLRTIGSFLSYNSLNISPVYASLDMLPSDGDAWTENDNATYIWVCSPSYKDDIGFVSSDSVVGNYSLNVNHTTTTAYMIFGLDIGSSQNLTAYDVCTFRFKMVRADGWIGHLHFHTGNTGLFAGDRHKVAVRMDANRWVKVVFPLDAFVVNSGSPDWGAKRYFDMMLDGLTNDDGAKVYVDGLYFSTWKTIIENTALDEKMLPNYDSFITRWEKTQVYNDVAYTSLYSMVPTNHSTFGYEALETETLGQTIYGYMYAYNYSRLQYYLDKAKAYVDWLLLFQYNTSDVGDGGFHSYFNNNTKTFSGNFVTTYNGWILAGLSYYYHFTNNSTIKTAADKLAGFLMDTMWDDTNKWYGNSYNPATKTIDDVAAWNPMPQGAVATGLSLYYLYVTQNSTVQTQLDASLNEALTTGSPAHAYYVQATGYEANIYAWTGFYWAYKAFNNNTYYTESLKAAKLTRADYEINGNGSVYYYNYLTEYRYLDGWGFACALPLLFTLYEETGDSNYLELFENQILELTPAIQTGNYSITRYRGSSDEWETYQYLPSNVFIVGALNAYYQKIYKSTNPYILTTDKEITASLYSSQKLTFTVSNTNFAGSTSTTQVCCGDKGQPIEVSGPISWSYDNATKILSITVEHSVSEIVEIRWLTGDVNGDGIVDIFDVGRVSAHWYPGPPVGPLGYDSNCDLNSDGAIDISDIGIVSAHWEETA